MQEKIGELKEKLEKVWAGGGPGRAEKQHAAGKLTARERLCLLLDPGSFTELDALAEHHCTLFGMEKQTLPADGVVTGWGLVDGRKVFVYAQDFTVAGGSLGKMHAQKITKLMDLALKVGAPVVGLCDSGGARIQEGVDSLSGYGEIFFRNTRASGVIPQISAIMGPCAGGATYSPALTDFILMVDQTSHMFITGPQVIKAVTGQEAGPEELGGARLHNSVSGVAHFLCGSEQEALASIRRLIGFLPLSNREDPPVYRSEDPLDRFCGELDSILPESSKRVYDMKNVIRSVVDGGDLMEIQPYFAENMIIGLARIGGRSVGVLANQPQVRGGSIDIDASDKASRFISFCDSFHIPLLTFVDVPGFLPGIAQEQGGIIRHGAKLLYAYSEATVPKVTVIVRKAYGGAYLAMCSKHLGADLVFAWPSAEIAVMGPEGAADVVFRKEIEAAEDPKAARKEKQEAYRREFANPYQAARAGFVDEVIAPSHTRHRVALALALLASKKEKLPEKKHGNFPV